MITVTSQRLHWRPQGLQGGFRQVALSERAARVAPAETLVSRVRGGSLGRGGVPDTLCC